jgi:hypothetical protein
VACSAFYERGFGGPSPDSLRVLHIAAFVTLCKSYMGIEKHFDLSSSGAKATVLGSTDIYVKSRHGVDLYFHLLAPGSMDGWQKVWFFFRNDANAPLLEFMGSRPVPQPNLEYKVAQRDLHRQQPLHEVIQQLRWEGLTGADNLWTFFSHRVKPLHQLSRPSLL